jgi:uncharacterized protein YprB with RNaseH-like and TPR domain
MQLDPQRYLDLVEQANSLAFVDIEATGLKGDYNSILVVSIKPYQHAPYSIHIKQLGNDQRVVKEVAQELAKYDCWATYYGSGFDIPMLNTRLLKWGQPPLVKRHHIDMYYKLKSHILTGRRSQGHLLTWLGTPEQKMSVSPDAWSEMGFKIDEHLPQMIERCESDAKGLQNLYERTRHLIRDIKVYN